MNIKESKNLSFFDESFLCKYVNKFKRSNFILELVNIYNNCSDFLEIENKYFSICGRIFRKRIMGKASFFEIKDMSGKIQLYLSKCSLKFDYESLVVYLSLGDIVGVSGYLFKTKTGEISLRVCDIVVLAKNLNLFPDKHVGLSDRELCYRQRYLDLMVNDDTQKRFILRSKIISIIRQFFIDRCFLEVETPMIQSIPGGAEAKPFETYHNYLDTKLFLRISPELYLKRLVVGGFERVFEIGKNFRNEGVSTRHHPEFTTIEFYQAYSDYKDMMDLTEILLKHLSNSIFGKYDFIYDNFLFDFSINFKRIDFLDAIVEYTEFSLNDINDEVFILNVLIKNGIFFDKTLTLGELQFKLFENFVEKKLLQPTFILHHPVEVSPLARKCDFNNKFVERFELYIYGREIANGFSELNDPEDQKFRFIEQLKFKNDSFYDKDFINALNFGLPPTAGEGIGIDRLIMLFSNSFSIKDVILFPLMRSKSCGE